MSCEIIYNASVGMMAGNRNAGEDEMPGGERPSWSGAERWTEDVGRYVISVAQSMTGVDAYRIRRYEAAGLLRPARTEGGRRLFSDREIHRIREIAKLENGGVNLKDIEVLLRKIGRDELQSSAVSDD